MSRFAAAGSFAFLALLTWVSSDAAQEPKKAAQPPEDSPVVKSTPKKVTPAASVKFRKDLGLPFASLATLGSRIDAARRTGDPVALANAASELDVAEKVAGKSASLTSKQVLTEAAELARLRKQEAELQAVLHMSDNVRIAQEQVDDLKKEIAFTRSLTAADKQALLKKEEPTGAPRKIVVNNYSTQYVEVQVNGYPEGQVSPGTTRVFTITQRWNPIVLKGWGNEDEYTFGPVVLQGRFDKYTWNINNDDAIPVPPSP
jgi:hypothetical protein